MLLGIFCQRIEACDQAIEPRGGNRRVPLGVPVGSSVHLLAVTPQIGSAQTWASWTSANAGNVFGTIGSTAVTYTGNFVSYDNSTASGLGFWAPSGAYSQSGVIAPTNPGLVRFTPAGRGTIFFGAPVLNPYIAFNSVGQPNTPVVYDFGTSGFMVVSNNNSVCAYWGCGSYTTTGNTLTGREFSGVAQFSGIYSQIDFSYTAEGWHGITVGVGSTNVVPEPSSYALMAAGLAGLFAVARRRRQAR